MMSLDEDESNRFVASCAAKKVPTHTAKKIAHCTHELRSERPMPRKPGLRFPPMPPP